MVLHLAGRDQPCARGSLSPRRRRPSTDARTPGAEGTAVHITFVTEPEPADRVIETGAAADVFVAPAAVALLDDQVLDAEVGPDGAVMFALHSQGSINGRPRSPGASSD